MFVESRFGISAAGARRSHLAHFDGQEVGGGRGMTATSVEVAPGSARKAHAQAPEQAYVVVGGRGLMRIGDEEREVGAGA